MSRPRYAVMALLAALLLSGCGTPANRAPVPDTAAVVEEQAPEPSAPPEPTSAPPPPEPDLSGDRNNDDVNEIRPALDGDL